MKRVLLIAFAVALVTALSAPAVIAGTNPNAVFTLHAKAHTTKVVTTCTTWSPNNGTPIPCSSYVTQWDLNVASDVYLVVPRGNAATGLAGISCGIWYDPTVGEGIDMYGWTLCADLQYPNGGAWGDWPNTGGGNRITWSALDACQRTVAGTEGVHAVAGAFYVFAYSPDKLQITENKNLVIPELAVADCNASTDFLPYGRAAFVMFSAGGTELGCNPCTEPDNECDIIATEPATWGGIKSKFGSN